MGVVHSSGLLPDSLIFPQLVPVHPMVGAIPMGASGCVSGRALMPRALLFGAFKVAIAAADNESSHDSAVRRRKNGEARRDALHRPSLRPLRCVLLLAVGMATPAGAFRLTAGR